ncbi:hypothetical protein AURDEDRAFT_175723 [Auricularia subglabra TFB-10046 SS5]|uniref:F-box domain-containing protein n=1 Tax=Auricularia subglabra (strain TFB-10046 / SS5) TaxID=717982 RepID=J0D7V9_AURST|nr:hypothetical protein AURDEDRAFT_175723 [Auricularia subglabra TFB-10046 SS5]
MSLSIGSTVQSSEKTSNTLLQADRERGLAQALPEDLVICVAGFLKWRELLHTAHVCRFWRDTVMQCPPLWASLDLYDIHRRALRVLPELLPLSGHSLLTLRIFFVNDDTSNNIAVLCQQLIPHVHRLRALTLRSRRRSSYVSLFALLHREAPALYHLDVSHDRSEYVAFESALVLPRGACASAPKLSSINWGGHALPIVPHRLFAVTSLSLQAPSPAIKTQIFTLFPCVKCLRLDDFSSSQGFSKLPADHPLDRMELRVRPIEKLPYALNWPHLISLGFGRLALLHLREYSASLVINVGLDPDWELQSVTIDYDDFVDASFIRRDSRSECRMSAMRPSRGTTWSMRRLMVETDWLRGLVSLTLSLALSVHQKRPSLLLPRGCLPALREFSLICGTQRLIGDGHVETWGSLFDADIMDECGVLEAPHLRVVRLLARPGDDAIVSPSALARFISDHVRVQGGRVPLLKISLSLRFADDAVGMAALREAVIANEHWL